MEPWEWAFGLATAGVFLVLTWWDFAGDRVRAPFGDIDRRKNPAGFLAIQIFRIMVSVFVIVLVVSDMLRTHT